VIKPRYPVYVISKSRWKECHTANFMADDDVDFHLVVEPQEAQKYRNRYGSERVIETPFSNLGLGGIPVRNFVWEHSVTEGHARHWIFDDNIRSIRRWNKGWRIPCDSNPALACVEDFTERYENIAISGLQYVANAVDAETQPPYYLNCHVYSALLIRNDIPYRWRGRYNEDTDLCLQVLSGGWCTVCVNAFLIQKIASMKMKGGNTDELYKGDGRLKMARSLERMWPLVVTTDRRYKRPQHVVHKNWKLFGTPLKRREDIDWDNMQPNEYGLKLMAETEVKSTALRKLLDESNDNART